MVITAKNNSKPRRVMDLGPLNQQPATQIHPTESPFLQTSWVPSNPWKTTMDSWRGYHSILLVDEDLLLDDFSPSLGLIRYFVLPQGFIAAYDAYTDINRFTLGVLMT